MARYRVEKIDKPFIIDTETLKAISVYEICDLLNAHDGMMTREQVEEKIKETKKTIQSCLKCCLVSNVIQFSAYCIGLETVLDGGTK